MPFHLFRITFFSFWSVLKFSFPSGSDRKEPACNTGDLGSIRRLTRFPGEGNGDPLHSCLENSVDKGAWRAIVRRVAKSQAWLNNNFLFFCTALICEFIYIVSVAAHFYYCVIHVSSYEHTTDSLFCCQTIYIIFNSLLLQTVPLWIIWVL